MQMVSSVLYTMDSHYILSGKKFPLMQDPRI